MFKKYLPILYIKLLFKMSQDFLDIQYIHFYLQLTLDHCIAGTEEGKESGRFKEESPRKGGKRDKDNATYRYR